MKSALLGAAAAAAAAVLGAGGADGAPTLGVTSGLVFRLEADGLAAGSLSTWADLSASGNDVSCSAAACPQVVDAAAPNGVSKVVRFDGVDDIMTRATFSGLPTGASARRMVSLTSYKSEGYGGVMYGQTTVNGAFGTCIAPNNAGIGTEGELITQLWGGAYDVHTPVVGLNNGFFIQTATVDPNGDGDHWVDGVAQS